MKKIQTYIIFAFVAVLSVSTVLFSTDVQAQNKCDGVDTAIISCDTGTGDGVENTGVWALLLLAINILTAGVGVAALGGIVYGSILYTSAGGSQEQLKKATTIITNVVVGMIAYVFILLFLNWLIPGGIFEVAP